MRRNGRDEAGSYLILGAVIMLALFLAAAVSIDVTRKYRLEQSLQDVADAAALAAAKVLPDTVAARRTAIEYIRQHTGGPTTDTAAFYTPHDSDIAVAVSADLTSGTVGVVVRAVWDPIFVPNFLTGADVFGAERYAIAVNFRVPYQDTFAGPASKQPGGGKALCAGETDPTVTSDINGNNIEIIGGAHFNHEVNVGGVGVTVKDGSLEAPSKTGKAINGTEDVPADPIPCPVINSSALHYDAVLDPAIPGLSVYYQTGPVPLVLDPGPDGLYGTADDVTLKQTNGKDVLVAYDGHDDWEITLENPSRGVDGTTNPTVGTGVDIKVVGDLTIALPNGNSCGGQRYWLGSIVTVTDNPDKSDGRFILSSNNAEIRAVKEGDAVPGLDNPGLAILAGEGSDWDHVVFENKGSAFNVYGSVYAIGTMSWTGNMSNPHSSSPGTEGEYDAVGNGFIKGQLVVGDLDSSGGGPGGLKGNNIKVWYDATLSGPTPIQNATTPIRLGPPTVRLLE